MRTFRAILLLVLGLVILAACTSTTATSPSPMVQSTPPLLTESPTTPASNPTEVLDPTTAPTPTTPASVDGRPVVQIDTTSPGQPIDPRLFGTNIPAWLGPSNLGRDDVLAMTQALGTNILRIPGGSWSNAYSWLACETGDAQKNTEDGCYWPWAARPTDFLNFVRATGMEAMWTVSINGTSKEAAALVAFFNGTVDDTTPIGVDVRGYDWKTVGYWAQLRADNGNPEPLGIKLWEVGNEVYGGKPDMGGRDCSEWGWEDVWTCDGTEYMLGKIVGSEIYEGYLDFRDAMRAVDPTILVGAVGVEEPDSWSDWGNEVIREGGENLDFYVIHHYAYSEQPPSTEAALARPQETWAEMIAATNAAFDTYLGRRIPIAVTEYNLVAFQDLDNDQLMTRAVNALFLADTLGQLATHGVAMANQWDLANGRANNGTDYGMIDMDTGVRAPQYYAMLLWSRFGSQLLPVNSPFAADTTLSVYAGRDEDGNLSLIAINKTDTPQDVRFEWLGASGVWQASVDLFMADTLEATEGTFNNNPDPAFDLADAPAADLGAVEGNLAYTAPPFSISLIRLEQ